MKLLREEVASLLGKGAVQVVDPTLSAEGFYSALFLVPKTEGRMRPVINLKALNFWVQPQHFKMEGIHTLREIVAEGEWLAKLDLKDAYFTVPIFRDHQKYLRFAVDKIRYQFTCLPFGLSCAPWAFTKVLKPVVAFLRSLGIRLIIYIDDILVIGKSPDEVRDHVEALIALLEGLGFIVNMEKSVTTPSQQIEFLGLQVDTITMCLSLPGHKIKAIRGEASQLLRPGSLSARRLAQFIGKLNATSQAVFPAPLFYRHLQRDLQSALLKGSQNYETLLLLSQESREEIQWWQQRLSMWNGRTLLKHRQQLVIQSDASLTGWGAVCEGVRTGGPWSPEEQRFHINCLELTAAILAVRAFAKDRSGISILLQLDNQTAVAYVNHLGGTVSLQLVKLAKTLWLWALQRDIMLSAQHIPGENNQVADAESRVTVDRLDWKLSVAVFQKINAVWGPLEVDLFATRLSTQLDRFFSWRPDPLAEATNAFQQDWGPLKAYANPPWCLMGRVLKQVKAQQAQVTLVAPVWKGQPWYPVLLEMLWDFPRWIPLSNDLFLMTSGSVVMSFQPQLAVWPICGKSLLVRTFQTRLGISSWPLGEASQTRLTIPISKNGYAGALQGVQIPFSGPVSEVANFLAELHREGYQSSSLNVFRSAVSSVHEKVDGVEIGKHPTITRLLKGAFHERPPLPRYVSTWDVNIVLQYLKGLGPSSDLSLKQLTYKLVMLLALTRPSRSADLSSLSLARRRFSPEGVTFLPATLAKQSRQGKPLVEFFFPSFSHDEGLCPVQTLRQYESVTFPLRLGVQQELFLNLTSQYPPVRLPGGLNVS